MGLFDLFFGCPFFCDPESVDFGLLTKTRNNLNRLRGAMGYCTVPVQHDEPGPLDCYKGGQRYGCELYRHGKMILEMEKRIEKDKKAGK